ncbi:ABC transporter ATP-binding protein [Hydrogenophaga sp. OTU3427]|uniref:ABC transporter ATP-binding protein n=1 Tax=Hydrogenophaga sp. OTU3427 TaxID=3043856 RepID=UPI00313D85F7
MNDLNTVLDVDDLHIDIAAADGRSINALQGVSLQVRTGEIVGVVGESGSGKSLLAKSIMRLLPPVARVTRGRVCLGAQDLLALDPAAMPTLRGGDLAMVFQDPMTSLNPVLRVGAQLSEAIALHQPVANRAAWAQARELLTRVGIPKPADRARQYPHEFSGGMRQRAMIAMGIANAPRLLIADEPTTALDVTVQLQILRLLKTLNQESHTSVLFITHNMGVVASLCDRVAVMYSGRIVEEGPVDAIFSAPRHPYTWALLNAVPRLDSPKGQRLAAIPGQAPDPAAPPPGCRFAPRCSYANDTCRTQEPVRTETDDFHSVACWVRPDLKEKTHGAVH